jgi:hypothetical protein
MASPRYGPFGHLGVVGVQLPELVRVGRHVLYLGQVLDVQAFGLVTATRSA